MQAEQSTRDRILDASVEAVSLYGLAKLSMSDVASRAQVSRPTLYKYFASKDELVGAAVGREAEVLVGRVLAAAAGHEDVTESIRASLVAALELTREHPLLDRIIRTEPESLLPYLTTDRVDGDGGRGGAAVLLFVRTATESIIRERLGAQLDEVTVRRLADMVARLLVSYAISAPDDPPEVVASVMARILVDGALSGVASAEVHESDASEHEPNPSTLNPSTPNPSTPNPSTPNPSRGAAK